jgi:hypothetical protein
MPVYEFTCRDCQKLFGSSDQCRNRRRPTSRAFTVGAPRSSGSGAPCAGHIEEKLRLTAPWSGTPRTTVSVDDPRHLGDGLARRKAAFGCAAGFSGRSSQDRGAGGQDG